MINFILAQVIGFLTIISTTFALLSKEKYKAMMWFLVTNMGLAFTYFLLSRVLGATLMIVSCIRNIIFYFYAKKQLKPSKVILTLLIFTYIGLSLIFGISLLDVIVLTALILITFLNWQDNMQVLRFGTMISSTLLLTYDALTGAYLSIGGEALTIVAAFLSLYKYKNKQSQSH